MTASASRAHPPIDDLVAAHRAELLAHCYRMLGSIHDADDALAETVARAWRALDGFDGRAPRAWLYRIATNVCLTEVERRRRRHLPTVFSPRDVAAAAEQIAWLEPFTTATAEPSPEDAAVSRESVELAFAAAYQVLPPAQRATLLLRDVLGYSAREAAAILDTTEAAANSSLQRARAALRRVAPDRSQTAVIDQLGEAALRSIVDRYVEAWERDDAAALVDLLTVDATFSMPPHPTWFQGRDAIGAFLRERPMRDAWRLRPSRTGGNLAFACYSRDDLGAWVANSVDVLELDGDRVSRIVSFMDPDLVVRLGHPAGLPG